MVLGHYGMLSMTMRMIKKWFWSQWYADDMLTQKDFRLIISSQDAHYMIRMKIMWNDKIRWWSDDQMMRNDKIQWWSDDQMMRNDKIHWWSDDQMMRNVKIRWWSDDQMMRNDFRLG